MVRDYKLQTIQKRDSILIYTRHINHFEPYLFDGSFLLCVTYII